MKKFSILFAMLAGCTLNSASQSDADLPNLSALSGINRAISAVPSCDGHTADSSAHFAEQFALATGAHPTIRSQESDALDGSDRAQLIPNVMVEGARFTLLLPPGWRANAYLPIVLSSDGTSPERGGGTGAHAALTVAQVAMEQDPAPIVAFTECMSGHGTDQRSLRAVATLLDSLDNLGGDKYSVMATGRDDLGAALLWAINPLNLDYDVHSAAISIAAGGARAGDLSRVTLLPPAGLNVARSLVAWELWPVDAFRSAGWRDYLRFFLASDDPAVLRGHLDVDDAGDLIAAQPDPASAPLNIDELFENVNLVAATALSVTHENPRAGVIESMLSAYLAQWNHGFTAADYEDHPWYAQITDYEDHPWYAQIADYEDHPWYAQIADYEDHPWYAQIADYEDHPWYVQVADYEDHPWYVQVADYEDHPWYVQVADYEDHPWYVQVADYEDHPWYAQVVSDERQERGSAR
ncbi:MAG: hypothetical protein Tsb0020_36170 [Haliangiales bacterium]